MIYYGNNDYRDYLAHHGVLGMHWGVRRYQPYSIGYQREGGEKGKFVGGGRDISKSLKKVSKLQAKAARLKQKQEKIAAKTKKNEEKIKSFERNIDSEKRDKIINKKASLENKIAQRTMKNESIVRNAIEGQGLRDIRDFMNFVDSNKVRKLDSKLYKHAWRVRGMKTSNLQNNAKIDEIGNRIQKIENKMAKIKMSDIKKTIKAKSSDSKNRKLIDQKSKEYKKLSKEWDEAKADFDSRDIEDKKKDNN